MNAIRKATERKRRMTKEAKELLGDIARNSDRPYRVYADVTTRALPTWAAILADRGYITMRTSLEFGTVATITDSGRKYLEDSK